MPGGRKRRAPAPFASFSTFARSLLFSPASGFSRLPLPVAPAAKPLQETAAMPPPSKRAKLAEDLPSDDEEHLPSSGTESDSDSSGSDGGSSSGSDDDASQEMETVQADFAFFDPKPSDFHVVRLLLKSYLDAKPWDLTGFFDIVLDQTTVGTVVKMAEDEDQEDGEDGDKSDAAGDDDDLFGLITVLNLGRYGENRCIKDLKDYLLSACGDKDIKKKLKSMLEEKASTAGHL